MELLPGWRLHLQLLFCLPLVLNPLGCPHEVPQAHQAIPCPRILGRAGSSTCRAPPFRCSGPLSSPWKLHPVWNSSRCLQAYWNLLPHPTWQAPPCDSFVKKTTNSMRGGDGPFHLCDSSWLTSHWWWLNGFTVNSGFSVAEWSWPWKPSKNLHISQLGKEWERPISCVFSPGMQDIS